MKTLGLKCVFRLITRRIWRYCGWKVLSMLWGKFCANLGCGSLWWVCLTWWFVYTVRQASPYSRTRVNSCDPHTAQWERCCDFTGEEVKAWELQWSVQVTEVLGGRQGAVWGLGIPAPECLSRRCLLPPESRSASLLSLLLGPVVSVPGVSCEARGRGRVPSSPFTVCIPFFSFCHRMDSEFDFKPAVRM